jgi:hypothetical protein
VTNYTYDNANRLTAAGAISYTWDANGNLLNDGAGTWPARCAQTLLAIDVNAEGHRGVSTGVPLGRHNCPVIPVPTANFTPFADQVKLSTVPIVRIPMSLPSAIQDHTLLSNEPVANLWPSADQARFMSSPVWPRRVVTDLPSAVHSLTILSFEAVARSQLSRT